MSLTQTPTRTIVTDAVGDTLDMSVRVIQVRTDQQWCPGVTTHLIPSLHVTPGMRVSLLSDTWVIRQVIYRDSDPGIIEATLRPVGAPDDSTDWTWELYADGVAEVDA